jgi:hypothetical protein
MAKGHLLALPLAAAQSLECRALEDSQSCRRLTTVIEISKYKQINNSTTNSTQ